MTRDRFILQLEDAADWIGDVPRHELQAPLRRAALRLRNVHSLTLDYEIGAKFVEAAQLTGTDCNELASMIINDWLMANGYLPFHDLDEETEPDGAA